METKNITMEIKGNGIAVITLDMQGEKVNSLNKGLMEDFVAVFDKVEKTPEIKAAVIRSGKKDNWIAGADIKMLAACQTEDQAAQLARDGHKIFFSIEKSKKPIVAAINGACLGGGLETALACQYRIATTSSKTSLGLVESMIGLIPGGGGTQRLPALIGIQESLTMITTGKQVKGDKAAKIGLIDQVCDPAALDFAAIQAAEELVAGTRKIKRKEKSLMNKILEDTPLRSVLFKKAREMADKKTQGNYPAIPAIFRCVEAGVNGNSGYETEAKEFGKLVVSPESEALRGIFFGQTALKKNRFGTPKGPMDTVCVLGAGLMGAGIAEVTVTKGIRVILKDSHQAGLDRGINQIKKNFDGRVKKKKMSDFKAKTTMSGILGYTNDDQKAFELQLKKTDLLVEAVPEVLSIKHAVIKQMEQHLPEHAIVATNTSALPIAEIAKASKRPERVIGMHYFSPVDKMPLLEIIPHDGTADEVSAAAVALGQKQGKTVIVVKDVPGFYVNRALGPVIIETMALLQDGVNIDVLNKSLVKFGMPVGPTSLNDEVGIDVAYHVADFLSKHLGDRMTGGDIGIMKDMIAAKMLGRKTGAGFFKYEGKKKEVNPAALEIIKKYQVGRSKEAVSQEDIQLRLMGRFVNEAMLCLQDGIISSPVDGDIGAVFGIGFPPFLGGPFRFIDTFGAQKYVDTMKRFEAKMGPQFTPCQLVVDLARKGGKFHN